MNAFAAANSGLIALTPRSVTGSSLVAGATLDKQAMPGGPWQYGKLAVATGATSGTPTSFTITNKLQHSDNGEDWTDLTEIGIVNAATVVNNAAGQIAFLDVNLNGTKRYVRSAHTPAFVDGSSPGVMVAAVLHIGEPRFI